MSPGPGSNHTNEPRGLGVKLILIKIIVTVNSRSAVERRVRPPTQHPRLRDSGFCHMGMGTRYTKATDFLK